MNMPSGQLPGHCYSGFMDRNQQFHHNNRLRLHLQHPATTIALLAQPQPPPTSLSFQQLRSQQRPGSVDCVCRCEMGGDCGKVRNDEQCQRELCTVCLRCERCASSSSELVNKVSKKPASCKPCNDFFKKIFNKNTDKLNGSMDIWEMVDATLRLFPAELRECQSCQQLLHRLSEICRRGKPIPAETDLYMGSPQLDFSKMRQIDEDSGWANHMRCCRWLRCVVVARMSAVKKRKAPQPKQGQEERDAALPLGSPVGTSVQTTNCSGDEFRWLNGEVEPVNRHSISSGKRTSGSDIVQQLMQHLSLKNENGEQLDGVEQALEQLCLHFQRVGMIDSSRCQFTVSAPHLSLQNLVKKITEDGTGGGGLRMNVHVIELRKRAIKFCFLALELENSYCSESTLSYTSYEHIQSRLEAVIEDNLRATGTEGLQKQMVQSLFAIEDLFNRNKDSLQKQTPYLPLLNIENTQVASQMQLDFQQRIHRDRATLGTRFFESMMVALFLPGYSQRDNFGRNTIRRPVDDLLKVFYIIYRHFEAFYHAKRNDIHFHHMEWTNLERVLDVGRVAAAFGFSNNPERMDYSKQMISEAIVLTERQVQSLFDAGLEPDILLTCAEHVIKIEAALRWRRTKGAKEWLIDSEQSLQEERRAFLKQCYDLLCVYFKHNESFVHRAINALYQFLIELDVITQLFWFATVGNEKYHKKGKENYRSYMQYTNDYNRIICSDFKWLARVARAQDDEVYFINKHRFAPNNAADAAAGASSNSIKSNNGAHNKSGIPVPKKKATSASKRKCFPETRRNNSQQQRNKRGVDDRSDAISELPSCGIGQSLIAASSSITAEQLDPRVPSSASSMVSTATTTFQLPQVAPCFSVRASPVASVASHQHKRAALPSAVDCGAVFSSTAAINDTNKNYGNGTFHQKNVVSSAGFCTLMANNVAAAASFPLGGFSNNVSDHNHFFADQANCSDADFDAVARAWLNENIQQQ